MFRKTILVFFLLLVFLEGFSTSCFTAEKDTLSIEKVLSKRPQEEQYCFDFADVVPAKIVDRINDEGTGLKNAFDIDFVIVVLPSLEKRELNEFAADLFSKWQIGKNTQGKKGLLILISMREQQIKTEVGYDLEEVYTDMYVGQVEREMLKEFLEQADWERGFLATIENFVERTYRAYKKGLAVKEITSSGKEDYCSGGAGAKIIFDFGAALKKPLPQTPQELRNYFTAQPAPELTFQRYMEFNAQNMSDYTLDIFSEDSKVFFSYWRTSSGQRRAEAEANSGKSYILKTSGRFAVLMAPADSSIDDFICQCPYFFVLSEKGWQVDINAMSRSLIMGGPTWHFLSLAHPYMFAFKNYVIKMNRYYPLEGQKAFLGLTYSLWDNHNNGFQVSPEWDSPAKKAGIEDGDILISAAGEKITQNYQDWEIMKRYNPGDTIEIVIARNNKKIKLQAVLEEMKSYLDEFPFVRKAGDPWTGLYFGYSQPYERDIEDVQLSVLSVVKNSPADKAGFKSGDLIYSVPSSQDQHVGFYDYKELLKRVKPKDKVKFKILRNLKERIELELEIGSYSSEKEGI